MTALLDRVPAQLPASGTCQIAFVGEAPSDHERLYGMPLVGPSGRVFDQLLRTSGLAALGRGAHVPPRATRVAPLLHARAPFLTTNVFDEQLPGNDVKAWCAPVTERKRWDGYSLARLGSAGYLCPDRLFHLSRLAGELQAAAPNLIVPLGSTALWALTGSSDLSIARGAVSTASLLVPGVKILPTYHPAHILLDWRLFHVAVLDLLKASREASFPEIRQVQREIHIRPDRADLVLWSTRLLGARRLAVDIETARRQITCIGFAPGPTEAFVVPFADQEKPDGCYWAEPEDEAAAWKMVRAVCESAVPKTFQNGLYDCYYLIRQAGIWPRAYDQDTRLQHHALFPEMPKSLAFLGATYTDIAPWKGMRVEAKEKKDA